MIQLIYMLTFMFSVFFMQMNHPMALGLMLLIQTIMISSLTGMITKSFWFSYMLFLIFLGGMLVLFIYVTSLASNEMFSLSMKMMFYIMLFLIIIICMNYFTDKMISMLNTFNLEMNFTWSKEMFIKENSLNLNKLYNYPTNFITILLMNYLLVTLIAIVKITKLLKGPLRLMN